MSYVDAWLDRKNDLIHISERIKNKRYIKTVPAEYILYYEHSAGMHRSMFGHSVKKFATNSSKNFYAEIKKHQQNQTKLFESDCNHLFRYLSKNYINAETPNLNIGFFDIEANWHKTRGWAPSHDPFNEITAITLYSSYDEKPITFVLKPLGLDYQEAQDIANCFEDTYLFDDEKELLKAFLIAIEDIDCFTTWNGNEYDIPYTINRIAKILGKEETKKFCLFDQYPTPKEYVNKFGKTINTFDLVGKVHLDYLELYAKHNPQQKLSYALNSIGQIIVKESKVQYEGHLDTLYNNEFKKFIEYNRQDTVLMVKIDQVLKYIERHNQIAHTNFIVMKTTMGSVSLVDQAIINKIHKREMVVPNRKEKIDIDAVIDGDLDDDIDIDDDDETIDFSKIEKTPVVGAYVAIPKKGMHKNAGVMDIKSLYPSTIRSLNMSPETLVGQVRLDETMKLIKERADKLPKAKKAEAWEGIFATLEVSHMHDKDDSLLIVDFFDLSTDTTTTKTMTGSQLNDYIFDPKNKVCITANGTIFRTDVDGIIPQVLAELYADRKVLQAQETEWHAKISTAKTPEEKKEAEYLTSFYHEKQQGTKIILNSLYGALLNSASRFYDERIGQSTTLTGRSIDKHMASKTNEIITGKYDYKGDAILYADTDSVFFTVENNWRNHPDYKDFDWSKENIIDLYDIIADNVNESFPDFMNKTFNASLERGSLISAGRELIASNTIFIKKKKYAMLMFDKEGERLDVNGSPGKLKIMGLDIKRADTPKYMAEFLEKLLMDILCDKDKKEMYDNIREFRKLFKTRPGWEKGSPKKISNLTKYVLQQETIDSKTNSIGIKNQKTIKRTDKMKVNMSGHAKASFQWNKLCEINNDSFSPKISDGTRINVCKLVNNPTGVTSVAYPSDIQTLPEWFKELPFDHAAMEDVIIDKKILNIVNVLNWDLTDTKELSCDEFFN